MRSDPDQVLVSHDGAIAEIALNDPARRNALGIAMFDALDAAIDSIRSSDRLHIVLIRGEGSAFCAGFDLAAASAQPALLATFIDRLSRINRSLRRMPQIVVAAVHGAAIAGGCAMLGACDFTFVARDAKLGYPVHRIGVSPAVTIPTLQQAIGAGPARALLMGGQLISGAEAQRIGLATHVCRDADETLHAARAHCKALAAKGTHALRVTKAWLNELDGSLRDEFFEKTVTASAELADTHEARTLLSQWTAGPEKK